jgi:signal transduction histidine kinase
VLEGSESVKTLHRHRRIGGGTLQVEIHGAPMRIQLDGEPRTLLVESIRDLEEQIRYSHEQRLSELGELAAGLAHEIHNPLASVRMALDMLLRGPDGVSTLAPATEEYLAVVDGEIDKCLEVTRRLLRLSAFPSGQPQLIEVNPTVTDILALVHWEAESRGVGIEQSLAEPSPRVLCSDSDLRMVLLNLVQNAFHAMPQGGHLEVFTRRRDRRAEVEVKDDGVGISPAHLAHIFDPFFSRRADQVRGTGLGLPISRAIVQRFGGQIRVDSHPGEGATFTVTLPDADPPGSNT